MTDIVLQAHNEIIRAALDCLRQGSGQTVTAVAASIGMQQTYLSGLLTGDRNISGIAVSTFIRLAQALGYEVILRAVEPEPVCDACGQPFTTEEWDDRHDAEDEDYVVYHARCCPKCAAERARV